MAITGTDVRELVDTWREAAAGMDRLDSGIESEVGKATLRLAASATVQHLATRAVGLDEATLQPARQWTADYVGGKLAETTVAQIDAKAKAAATASLSAVGTWAMTGNGPLLWSGFVGVAFGIVLAIIDFGRDVTLGFLTGTIVVPGGVMVWLLRGLVWTGNNAAAAVRTTWAEAQAVGLQADKVMAPVVAVERRLWTAAGGAARPAADFTAKARERAKWTVAGAIALASFGVILLIIGGYSGYMEWDAARTSTGF